MEAEKIKPVVVYSAYSILDEHFNEICDWLSPLARVFERKQQDLLNLDGRQDGIRQWFFDTPEFSSWIAENGRLLWCSGIRTTPFQFYLRIFSLFSRSSAYETLLSLPNDALTLTYMSVDLSSNHNLCLEYLVCIGFHTRSCITAHSQFE